MKSVRNKMMTFHTVDSLMTLNVTIVFRCHQRQLNCFSVFFTSKKRYDAVWTFGLRNTKKNTIKLR